MEQSKVLRLKDVMVLTRVSKSQIYRLMAAGEFPHPKKHGRVSFWVREEVDKWVLNILEG